MNFIERAQAADPNKDWTAIVNGLKDTAEKELWFPPPSKAIEQTNYDDYRQLQQELRRSERELMRQNDENEKLARRLAAEIAHVTAASNELANAYEILNAIYESHGDCHDRHAAWLQRIDGKIRT